MTSVDTVRFTSAGLKAAGFSGFQPLTEGRFSGVPVGPGVFVVLRDSSQPPSFLHDDPTLPRGELYDRWVPDAPVLMVGRTSTLRRGMEKLAHRNQLPAHWSGRVLWQLADAKALRVAWISLARPDQGVQLRTRLLDRFLSQFGRPPFGNLRLVQSNVCR